MGKVVPSVPTFAVFLQSVRYTIQGPLSNLSHVLVKSFHSVRSFANASRNFSVFGMKTGSFVQTTTCLFLRTTNVSEIRVFTEADVRKNLDAM